MVFKLRLKALAVLCLVKIGDRGMQAFRVLSMDTTTALHPLDQPGDRTHVQVVAESGIERALVKWFNRTKGLAF
jgi:CspA family cold shock protein